MVSFTAICSVPKKGDGVSEEVRWRDVEYPEDTKTSVVCPDWTSSIHQFGQEIDEWSPLVTECLA